MASSSRRSGSPVAVVVGTGLSVIIQGDVVLAGMTDERVGAKMTANLAIPFLTSSTGALLGVRGRLEAVLGEVAGP